MAFTKKNLAAELAARTRIHVNIIAELQRSSVLPADLNQFTAEDAVFIKQFQKTFGNKKLLRLQLVQLPQREREKLTEHVGDWKLKRWERWALGRFMVLYQAKLDDPSFEIDSAQIVAALSNFGTLDTPWVIRRVSQLRQIAAKRVHARERRLRSPEQAECLIGLQAASAADKC